MKPYITSRQEDLPNHLNLIELSPKYLSILLAIADICLILAALVGYTVVKRLFGDNAFNQIFYVVIHTLMPFKNKTLLDQIKRNLYKISIVSVWAIFVFYALLAAAAVFINTMFLRVLLSKVSARAGKKE